MTADAHEQVPDANRLALLAAVEEVRGHLEAFAAAGVDVEQGESPVGAEASQITAARLELPGSDRAGDEAAGRIALDEVTGRFNLSPFERHLLLLCAGVELDASFADLVGGLQGDVTRILPTFGLALAALPDAHWSALAPVAALRHWRLIEVQAGSSLTSSPLRVDERVLHFLTGVTYPEPRLRGVLEPVSSVPGLAPGQVELAKRIVEAWSAGGVLADCAVIELCGDDPGGHEAIAATAAGTLGFRLQCLRAGELPAHPDERVQLARLWERESLLTESALLISVPPDADGEAIARVRALVREVVGLVVVSTPASLSLSGRSVLTLTADRPGAEDQLVLWRRELGAAAVQLNGTVERVAGQFRLDVPAIRRAAQKVAGEESGELPERLWAACRLEARTAFAGLAQLIEPFATWDDLILPAAQKQVLRTIVAQVRQRATVWDRWGFGRKSSRGLGIHALFAGPSGTGKTMAAEVMARELSLDLHRIDLSALVSKYIGETEKNLRRVFDAAERGGSILLFDEADALFGKRSEVRDSHDRYANIEVSYLLQRIESYRGLAILTTNLKTALDPAFTRRLRFTVHFTFPDQEQRLEIWRRVFPEETPREELNYDRLARLSLSGGHIRNLALNAAFLAADAGEPVRMTHLLVAAHAEFAKLEKPLSPSEVAGWI
jgi:hypothetical protein